MSSYKIMCCDADRLNIRPERYLNAPSVYEELRRIEQDGGVLYWNHKGVVGRVSLSVLRDGLDIVDTYFPQHYQPRVVRSVPAAIGWITWDQAEIV